MLQLLSPAGLWALAALSLPLAIHLWRPPPRTVRLGSLRFLENVPLRVRHLRWRERVLLAVRLGLLTVLALLLAGPRWQPLPPRGPQRWILLDPGAGPSGGSLKRLNALRADGYETVPAPGGGGNVPDVWSWMREADAELPGGSSLAVFSPGRLAELRGSRPALRHCRVEWVQTPDAPALPAPARTPPPPLEVLILHDADRAAEARALAAAIHAAGHADVRTEAADPPKGNSAGAGWIFWLSARPAPTVPPGANLFSEAAGAADGAASWIVPGVPAFLDPVRLWQRTPPDDPGAVWWRDGFGQPLLTRTREGQGWHWRFFGRLDPAWTDLTRGSAFPAALRAMTFPPDTPAPDRRLADPSQCRPAEMPPAGRDVTLSRDREGAMDLHGPLWTLAAALFGLERALSHRRQRPVAMITTPEPVAVLSR